MNYLKTFFKLALCEVFQQICFSSRFFSLIIWLLGFLASLKISLVYRILAIGSNIVLCVGNLLRVDFKCFYHTYTQRKLCEMLDVLVDLIVVIISHCIYVSTHHVVTLKVKVAQTCLTLHDPKDYINHEILQARILEWVSYPFFRGSSQPRD